MRAGHHCPAPVLVTERPLTHAAALGASWRSGPTAVPERHFYPRRMTLITELQRLAAASGAPDAEAYDRVTRVPQLEDERKRDRTSLSSREESMD